MYTGPVRRLLCRVVLVAGVTLPFRAVGQPAPPARPKLPPDYRIKLAPKLAAEQGKPATVSFTLAAQPGYTISRDGPLVLDLGVLPKQGLLPRRHHYRRKHAADARADSPRFDLTLSPTSAGTYRLDVTARFWVCARYTCRPVRDRRTVAVTVTPPTPIAPSSQPSTQPTGATPPTEAPPSTASP